MIEGVKILLVDDHNVVRSSLALMLQSFGARVVGEAQDGHSAMTQALALRPDVILMDITLPDMDGIQVTRQIVSAWPEARVLALTMHSEQEYLVPFLEAGGVGFVRKSAADREVLAAIQTVLKGQPYLGRQGLRALLDQTPAGQPDLSSGPDALSDRERTVLEKIARGFTSREIAEQLNLSPHTVDTYRSRIMEKLGLTSRHELVDFAIRHRLLG